MFYPRTYPLAVVIILLFVSVVYSVSIDIHREQYLEKTPTLLSEFERKHRIFGNLIAHPNTDPWLYPATVRIPAPSVCERKKKKSVFVYGKCPEECTPFSLKLFYSCAGMIQFGCQMVPCPDKPGSYTCSLNPDAPKSRTICPGDKVIFDSVRIEKLNIVTYSIDLQANPLKTDLYILADATGSMRRALDTARRRAHGLLSVLAERPSVAFGIGQYRDEKELHNGFENLQSITGNRQKATSAIRKWVARGGRDRDEANLVALYKIATEGSIGWRNDSRRIVVYFGDWPGHEPTCYENMTITRDTVIRELNNKNITVIAVNFRNLDAVPRAFGCAANATKAKKGQASDIVEGTTGNIISSTQQTRLIELVRTAVRALPKTFAVDDSECQMDIKSVHEPSLPLEVMPGASTTVTNTMTLKPQVCDTKGKFACNLKYTEGGASMKDTTIEMVNVKGCPTS